MAMSTFLKTLLLPALLALALFLFTTFAIIPLVQRWRRYRNRYTQYAPLGASQHSFDAGGGGGGGGGGASLLPRLGNIGGLLGHLLPEKWKDWVAAKVVTTHGSFGRRRRVVDGSSPIADEENLADLVDEEELESFDEERERQRGRREALSLSLQRGRRADESSERRLSRELEEGFCDDSDEEEESEEEDRRPTVAARGRATRGR